MNISERLGSEHWHVQNGVEVVLGVTVDLYRSSPGTSRCVQCDGIIRGDTVPGQVEGCCQVLDVDTSGFGQP
jgi:hypothetical protein